jgi:hypothetical protein
VYRVSKCKSVDVCREVAQDDNKDRAIELARDGILQFYQVVIEDMGFMPGILTISQFLEPPVETTYDPVEPDGLVFDSHFPPQEAWGDEWTPRMRVHQV